jgi:uroporphyrinogen decarboxylase
MRQAGRYMVEYRTLREKYSILEIIKTPELACEVTLQPINAFNLDAAIIFADILPPLEGMGLELDFIKGEGPTIYNPIRTADDIERLRVLPPEETLAFTLEAIRLVRRELDARGIPLIGFSGAPFTLASYAIEGGSSRSRIEVKNMMMSQPELWHKLMTKLSEVAGHYLLAQAQAGAHALQLFDSWVGALSPYDYELYVLPLIRAAGGDVIGIDWRIDLAQAWQILGDEVSVQSNLDPVALFADWEALQARARHILDSVNGKPGHIFNLGHGILPETPVDNVRRLVDFVHEYSQKQNDETGG